MQKDYLTIDRIPSVLWGAASDKLLLAIHGDQSHKEDAVIQIVAAAAVAQGYQVLSFDLPKHGARTQETTLCKVQTCVPELQTVLDHVKASWSEISLFACSIGAYFSLVAYADAPLKQALFLSPVVDMERLIENMLTWFKITPAQLEEQQTIPTPIGQTLYWDYYMYVKAHPINKWDTPTHILYGENDAISEPAALQYFAQAFDCQLSIVYDGEHFFNSEEELAVAAEWLQDTLV